VNDVAASVVFYRDILGFADEGRDGPFTVVRVDAGFTLQLSPYGTEGGTHLAFALAPDEFEAAFARIRASVPYGGTFDTVGSGVAPGRETGARGLGDTVYFFDPNKHLIEIRTYR
jgi:catechol 2,3-dioxygenase-like lactoylglutathione lyase family enzyme